MIISINGFRYDIDSSNNKVDILIYERGYHREKNPLELTEIELRKVDDPEIEDHFTVIEFSHIIH